MPEQTLKWIPERETLIQAIAEEQARQRVKKERIRATIPFTEEIPQYPVEQVIEELPPEVSWMPQYEIPRPKPAMPEMPLSTLMPTPLEPETPWYRTPLELLGKGFEFVQEKLEKPWAAALTAPLSPTLPWQAGETWFEHEKREYKAWEAPKFVKGAAEFSMPLWWLPYFGWAAKGAGLIPRIGGTLAKGILSAEKILALPITLPARAIGKGVVKIVELPALEALRTRVFKADRFRLLAQKLSTLPGFKSTMGIINPSAVASGVAQEGRVLYGGLREAADNSVNLMITQLQLHPEPRGLFGLDDMLRSTTIKAKTTEAAERLNWWDIATNPKAYELNVAQEGYIKDYHALLDATVAYAEKQGLKINKLQFMEGMHYVPRVWQGKLGLFEADTGIFRPIGTALEPEKWAQVTEIPLRAGRMPRGIGAKAFFERPRYYEWAEEALAKGLRPGTIGPNETMSIFLKGLYRRIVDNMTADSLKPLGRTIKELTPIAVRQPVAEAVVGYRALRRLTSVIPRVRRGESLPAQTLKVIERDTPEFAKRLADATTLTGRERDRALIGLRKEAVIAKDTAWQNYIALRSERTKAYEYARRMPGWRAIGQPFAAGRLFPDEIANDLTKMMQDRGLPILSKVSNVNALSRFMVTGFDFGAGLIQGIPLLMSNPIRWGKSMGISIKAFTSPSVRAEYLTRPENIAVLQKLIPEGLLIGNSEYMEAVSAGGLLARAPNTLLKLTGAQRWATSFNTWGDVARVEWAKGLLPMVEREGKSLAELSAFINEATGVMSSRALGVGATQRELEGSVFLFAPRYFRANMSLWADMTRGGLRGELARNALVSMVMGGFFWYYGLAKTLGQEPNFDPTSGRFMTVEIAGQHVGFGSMQVANLRLLGNIYRTATENPEGFIKLNSRDNPLVQFLRSRVAPVTGASWDILTGKSYIGEPLDNPARLANEVVIRRILPFWLSGYITEEPKAGIGGLTEIFGTRTWPLQLWEKRDELRNRYALADYGKPWYSTKEITGINEVQKRMIEKKYDDLRAVSEAATAQRVERGGVQDEQWRGFQDDRKRARAVYDSKLWGAQELYDKGEITGYDFRLLTQSAGGELRGAYRNIETNPAYEKVMEVLNQPMTAKQMRDTPMEDIAFDIYASLMYSGDLEDEAGQYDFEEAQRREQVFVAQFGQEMLDYVRQRLSVGKEVPPLMQEYYKAREILQPYWEVRDYVIKRYGEPKTPSQENRIQGIINRIRQGMRRQDPDIAKYYILFYTRPR